MDEKEIVGLVERIVLYGENKKAECYALIDTGATSSSMDIKIASELGLKVSGHKYVKGKTFYGDRTLRPTVKARVEIKGKIYNVGSFTLADRSSMSLPVIIGRDILFNNFIVDVSLYHNSKNIDDLKEKVDLKEVKYYEI